MTQDKINELVERYQEQGIQVSVKEEDGKTILFVDCERSRALDRLALEPRKPYQIHYLPAIEALHRSFIPPKLKYDGPVDRIPLKKRKKMFAQMLSRRSDLNRNGGKVHAQTIIPGPVIDVAFDESSVVKPSFE